MSDTLNLGHIITGEAKRDATHIAVAPVVAKHSMSPGSHVGIDPDGEASMQGEPIGIVDPYLDQKVMKGERFWLFLYPGTITGLRHEWTHPAFEAPTSPVAIPTPEDVSRRWLENIAMQCGVSYDRMITAVDQDDYISMGENESYKDVLDSCLSEFKKHCEIVLKRPLDQPYPFSCPC